MQCRIDIFLGLGKENKREREKTIEKKERIASCLCVWVFLEKGFKSRLGSIMCNTHANLPELFPLIQALTQFQWSPGIGQYR